MTTSPVSSNPEGPDFIDDDASYDDAPAKMMLARSTACSARAAELSADGKHAEAVTQMDAALARAWRPRPGHAHDGARRRRQAYWATVYLVRGSVAGYTVIAFRCGTRRRGHGRLFKGGADVRAVNARGEHCVGLARKAAGGPAPRQLRDGHGRGRRA